MNPNSPPVLREPMAGAASRMRPIDEMASVVDGLAFGDGRHLDPFWLEDRRECARRKAEAILRQAERLAGLPAGELIRRAREAA